MQLDYQFSDELQKIIEDYKDFGDSDPLDGDEVDRLVELLRNRINLNEGNITQEEFNRLENLKL